MLVDHEMAWQSGNCTHCNVHRSTWDPQWGGDRMRPALVPTITFCLPCQMYAQLEAQLKAQGDQPGYHITWKRRDD